MPHQSVLPGSWRGLRDETSGNASYCRRICCRLHGWRSSRAKHSTPTRHWWFAARGICTAVRQDGQCMTGPLSRPARTRRYFNRRMCAVGRVPEDGLRKPCGAGGSKIAAVAPLCGSGKRSLPKLRGRMPETFRQACRVQSMRGRLRGVRPRVRESCHLTARLTTAAPPQQRFCDCTTGHVREDQLRQQHATADWSWCCAIDTLG